MQKTWYAGKGVALQFSQCAVNKKNVLKGVTPFPRKELSFVGNYYSFNHSLQVTYNFIYAIAIGVMMSMWQPKGQTKHVSNLQNS